MRDPSVSPSVLTVINFPKEKDPFIKAELPDIRICIIQCIAEALSDVLFQLLCVRVGATLPIAQLGGHISLVEKRLRLTASPTT